MKTIDKAIGYLRSKKSLFVVVAAVCFGVALGYGLKDDGLDVRQVSADLPTHLSDQQVAGHEYDQGSHMQNAGGKADHNPQNAIYVCPMNCVDPMTKPGRCPVCGMDLVAMNVQDHQQMDHPTRITLSKQDEKIAGIQVAPVEEKFVSADVRLYGKIEYDPVEQYKVTAYAPGVIDNIYVRRAGQVVRKGDPLFDLNSAELYFLEQEFFKVLEKLPYDLNLRPGKFHSRKRVGRWSRLLLPPKESGGKRAPDQKENELIQKELKQIERKMKLLGLSEKDIEGLMVKGRPTGIATITTPMTGVVLEQNAFRGTFVNTGDVVFTVANPRVLWARLDAYASDFPWIRLGQEAEFETDAYPGKSFKGKVLYLDPEFDEKRRVFKVGVLYNDEKGLLKPNMLVRCVIHAKLTAGGRGTAEIVTQGMMGTAQVRRTDQAPLVIPDTAPLTTGKRAVVYVQVPDKPGSYVGREVVLGPRAQGYYVVNEGLHEGELVVVNGSFKIDSAVQILAKSSMMSHESSELPVDHYDQVQTPPLPKELQGENSDKGAKFEIYSDRQPASNQAPIEKTSRHGTGQHHAGHDIPEEQRKSLLSEKPPPPAKISGNARCPVCGMYPARNAKWHTQILFSDGGSRAFDGPKDMFKYLSDMAKYEKQYAPGDIAAIYVKDFGSGKWLDAKNAYFVIGSKISGPMGKELIPFEDHMQAMKVENAGGGRVARYSEINPEMIQSAETMHQAEVHQQE